MNKLSKNEIQKIIEVGNVLGIVDFSILEKDMFVTKAIHALADKDHQFNLVFCGGTCLAKAHNIISRMSEDVDFKIFPLASFSSISEQRKRLKEYRDQIVFLLKASGFEINDKNFRSRDNNSYTIYHLEFPSHFELNTHLKPHIQLEFTLATPRLPTEIKPISALVDSFFPDESDTIQNIHCISIIETAAEKWVALTRRVAAIYRGHDPFDETLVRHLYDLQSIIGDSKIPEDFYVVTIETINRDQLKFKRHHEYRNNPLVEINYSIKVIGSDPVWLIHYNNFVETMVYSKEKEDFFSCYEFLQKITEQIIMHPEFKRVGAKRVF